MVRADGYRWGPKKMIACGHDGPAAFPTARRAPPQASAKDGEPAPGRGRVALRDQFERSKADGLKFYSPCFVRLTRGYPVP